MFLIESREDGDRTTGITTLCYRRPDLALADLTVDRDTILGRDAGAIADRLAGCNGRRKVRLLRLDDAKDLVAEVLRGNELAIRWGGYSDGWRVRQPTTTIVMAARIDKMVNL